MNLDIKGVTVVNGGGGGSVVCYLRKKAWLRIYHAVMIHDVSEFLLDPFGNPVSFNRVKKGDMFLHSLHYSSIHGYRCSVRHDSIRISIECVVDLGKLISMPWMYGSKTKTEITQGDQYRIGRVKSKSTMGDSLRLIRSEFRKLNGKPTKVSK